MTTWARLATATLSVTALVAAGGTAHAAASAHGSPVVEPAPQHPPTMARSHGVCTMPGASSEDDSGSPSQGLLWVRAHPTGMVAIWLSGLNAKHCVARRTVSGAGLAHRVAAAILQARAFPTQPLPCPYDDGTAVRLYFTYAQGGDGYAAVALSGCRPISAPGRAARWSDPAVERPLRRAAPSAWRSYLGT